MECQIQKIGVLQLGEWRLVKKNSGVVDGGGSAERCEINVNLYIW